MSQKSITSFFKPKPVAKRPGSPEPTNGKRMKADAVSSPSNASIEATRQEIRAQCLKTPALSDTIGISWFRALKREFNKEYFVKLSQFLKEERQRNKVFPPEDQVFAWTQYCSIRDVKVVILGQDPYHNVGQAHGLCFSVPKGVPPPPSLLNIFKELAEDIPDFQVPKHGDLTGWAKQGVLLLNACLTVRAHNANSHAGRGWEFLTDAVIKWLNENTHGVVFLLWGSYAQKKCSSINSKRHVVLKTVHPSPLSAMRGFFGCKHFSKANAALQKLNKPTIDWCDLP